MALEQVMRREDKARSGMALGGLGTGSIELRKDGCFYNWTIFNNHPYGTGPRLAYSAEHYDRTRSDFDPESLLFFIVRYRQKGRQPQMKLLQIDPVHHVAAIESHPYIFPWLSGVDRIDSTMSYPFARLRFTDAQMPLAVEMEAFCPFIPHDVTNSALPAVFFRFSVVSKTAAPVEVMLLASLRNLTSYDTAERIYATRIIEDGPARIVEMSADQTDKSRSTWGTMAIASLGRGSSFYAGWEHIHPYYERVLRGTTLGDVDDTAGRNTRDREGKVRAMDRLWSSVACSKTLKGRGARLENTFVMSWHFPNLYAAEDRWTGGVANGDGQRRIEGHWYARNFADAAEVARYARAHETMLRDRSRAFCDALLGGTAPRFVLEQVNSQLNTFATSSWLTKQGDFGIIEGLLAKDRRGALACLDVGMYGAVMTAALFPEVDRASMRAHARLADPVGGCTRHSIDMNFQQYDVHEFRTGRLDLPSQFVLMALRAYFWSGDRTYLAEVWPAVKGAIEYVLRERDANGDLLPDMEGIMSTYDNFPMYGAASLIAGQFLAALQFAARAAEDAGDAPARQRYEDIYSKGREVFERKLWNGKYYRLWNDEGGKHGGKDEGCLTDQLIGQWAMEWTGFGSLLEEKRMREALKSVVRMSGREYGLVNCRWPEDGWLHEVDQDTWVDQANTCWTGVELGFASLLIYRGMVREGLAVVRNVDSRYRKAGMYFDHQEFGGHYYRAMSAWGVLMALLGYSADRGRYRFAPRLPGRKQRIVFSFAGGWGAYERDGAGRRREVRLTVQSGRWKVKALELGLDGGAGEACEISVGRKKLRPQLYAAKFAGQRLMVEFAEEVAVEAGEALTVRIR